MKANYIPSRNCTINVLQYSDLQFIFSPFHSSISLATPRAIPTPTHASSCPARDFQTDQPTVFNFFIIRKHYLEFKLFFPMLLTGAWISLQIFTSNNSPKWYFLFPSSFGATNPHTTSFFLLFLLDFQFAHT